jgi:5-methylcytosine-specific restriction endonuclease McrA
MVRLRRYALYKSGDVTTRELRDIYDRDNGCCIYCGSPVKARFNPLNPIGFDHRIPFSKGGRHTKDNIDVCCWPCNHKKFTKVA